MVISKNVTITATATAIYKSTSNGCRVWISHPKNGNPVTLGSSTVTFGVGLALDSKVDIATVIDGTLPPGDTIYGICEAGKTQVLGVLVIEF